MTATPENARRSLAVFRKGLNQIKTASPKMYDFLFPMADSVAKCLDSLARQVEFYEGIKSPLRTMRVTNGTGEETVSAMELHALDLPGTEVSFGSCTSVPLKVYGTPQAIAALTDLLAAQAAPVEHTGEAEPCTTPTPPPRPFKPRR